MANPRRFRVALSFPGEHRKRVEAVALALAATLGQNKILYDKWYGAEFARPNLALGLLGRGTPADLDEVFRIATRSGMKLYLTDYHLASARLTLNDHDRARAREHTDKAAALIAETGYHRRDKALAELRAEIEKLP